MQSGSRHEWQARGLDDRIALRVDVLRLLQRPLHHQADQRLGDEVEQQCADYLEHAEPVTQPHRDRHPGRAGEQGATEHGGDRDDGHAAGNVEPDRGRRDRARIELPFGADVQGTGPECDRDPQPDHDQRHRSDQRRRAEGVPRAERPAPQRGERDRCVVPGQLQADRQHGEPEDHGQDRPPSGHRSPSARRSATASHPRARPAPHPAPRRARGAPARAPRRDRSSRPGTAAPAAAATRRRAWIAPVERMSSPRVGFSATITRGARASSRASTTFC